METLLRDEEWGKRSDRWIAKACAVSKAFVGTVRQATGGHGDQVEGQDGKTYKRPSGACLACGGKHKPT